MRILGIDYGDKRIGLAISDEEGKLAGRFLTLENISQSRTIAEIIKVISENNIQKIIIGVPVGFKNESEQTAKTKNFIKTLREKIELPIVEINEIFTSKMAEKNLRDNKMNSEEIKEIIDQEAARIILQDFLDRKI